MVVKMSIKIPEANFMAMKILIADIYNIIMDKKDKFFL